MASVIYRRPAGTGLTREELAMLEEAEKYPIEYDEDSPKLTQNQLAQFRPVHYATYGRAGRSNEARDFGFCGWMNNFSREIEL